MLKKVIPSKLLPKIRSFRKLWRRWFDPVIPIGNIASSFGDYLGFWADWINYTGMKNAEDLRLIDGFPRLTDRTPSTAYDRHYFYQDIWALRNIQASRKDWHIDIGSRAIFAGMLSTVTKVLFIDIRPLVVKLDNFFSLQASLLALPFQDNSALSLSCLHVSEHIGLGRYGDPLDPDGTRKATRELTRVLAPGGNLYFSLPVGQPRVCFNAHRIHSPSQILDYFDGLKLIQFSGINDENKFKQWIDPSEFSEAKYACGLFQFTKEK